MKKLSQLLLYHGKKIRKFLVENLPQGLYAVDDPADVVRSSMGLVPL
jgi:hypothetical protein